MNKLNKILPHGEIKKVFENIWFIEGQVKMPMLMPMKISKAMTIIKNPDTDELTLVNTMPLNDDGLRKLNSLGKIKNTLRIGGFHGRDDAFYKEKFGATVYALKGHGYSKKFDKIPIDPKNGYMQADILLDEDSELPIPNATLKLFKTSSPVEAILHLDLEGGVLVTGDSLQNTGSPDSFFNLPAKIMMKKFGFFKPYNVGPGWVQFASPSIREIRSILDLDFDHVLPGHGEAVIGSAKEKYRPVLESEIKGCHE